MNSVQRACLTLGLLAAAILLAFPPVPLVGRTFILYWNQPLFPVDTGRLWIELGLVGVVTLAAVVFMGGRSPSGPRDHK